VCSLTTVHCVATSIHASVRLGSDDRLCCLVVLGARLDGTRSLWPLPMATGGLPRAGRSFYEISRSGV
jgi:hypothetical protein